MIKIHTEDLLRLLLNHCVNVEGNKPLDMSGLCVFIHKVVRIVARGHRIDKEGNGGERMLEVDWQFFKVRSEMALNLFFTDVPSENLKIGLRVNALP